MKRFINTTNQRTNRRRRIRARISGTSVRPRLSVFRSATGMYAQLIDDTQGKTLVAGSTAPVPAKADVGERTGKVAASYVLGTSLAALAKEKGITTVVFDRGGFRYHGRVKALADGARDGGLLF